MTTKLKSDMIVRNICCDYDRVTLNNIVLAYGYNNPHKFHRCKLENITYIIKFFDLNPNTKYGLLNTITGERIFKRVHVKTLINFLIKKCNIHWYEQPLEIALPINERQTHILHII